MLSKIRSAQPRMKRNGLFISCSPELPHKIIRKSKTSKILWLINCYARRLAVFHWGHLLYGRFFIAHVVKMRCSEGGDLMKREGRMAGYLDEREKALLLSRTSRYSEEAHEKHLKDEKTLASSRGRRRNLSVRRVIHHMAGPPRKRSRLSTLFTYSWELEDGGRKLIS